MRVFFGVPYGAGHIRFAHRAWVSALGVTVPDALHGSHLSDGVEVGPEVIDGKVRVDAHHRGRGPSAHFLDRLERSAGLRVPAGPGVAQVVPVEVIAQAERSNGAAPGFGVYFLDRAASEDEDVAGVSSALAFKDGDGRGAQWDRVRAPCLELIWRDPGDAGFEIDPVPAQIEDVSFSQAGFESERDDVLVMVRQARDELTRLVWGEPADSLWAFGQQLDIGEIGKEAGGRSTAKDGSNDFQPAVYGTDSDLVTQPARDQLGDHAGGDPRNRWVAEILIYPAQHARLVGARVLRLGNPELLPARSGLRPGQIDLVDERQRQSTPVVPVHRERASRRAGGSVNKAAPRGCSVRLTPLLFRSGRINHRSTPHPITASRPCLRRAKRGACASRRAASWPRLREAKRSPFGAIVDTSSLHSFVVSDDAMARCTRIASSIH